MPDGTLGERGCPPLFFARLGTFTAGFTSFCHSQPKVDHLGGFGSLDFLIIDR
jgi:hypothetical protein